MNIAKMTRLALPAACCLGLMAAPALAQTAAAPTTTATTPPTVVSTAPAAPGTAKAGLTGNATATAAASSTSKMASRHSRMPTGETFKTVALATAHCPSDTVVWSTLSKSKSYHLASSKYYGKTKHGAYVCQKDATAAGFHPAKT